MGQAAAGTGSGDGGPEVTKYHKVCATSCSEVADAIASAITERFGVVALGMGGGKSNAPSVVVVDSVADLDAVQKYVQEVVVRAFTGI